MYTCTCIYNCGNLWAAYAVSSMQRVVVQSTVKIQNAYSRVFPCLHAFIYVCIYSHVLVAYMAINIAIVLLVYKHMYIFFCFMYI